MTRALARLRSDTQGATIVEFALITPALAVLMMGLFDLAYNMYTSEMLQGAIHQAARKSTIQGASGNEAAIDASVTRAIKAVAVEADVEFERESFNNFADINRPEDFDDINGNGTCDAGEPYEDVNGNAVWDQSRGTAGFGGARDATLYTVKVTYPRLFPIAGLIPGQTKDFQLKASTVLRNQPYDAQSNLAPVTGACT